MLKSDLPNLFDQYSQEENRVTNALLQTVAASPRLARSFLHYFARLDYNPRKEKVVVSCQKKPEGQGDRLTSVKTKKEIGTVPDGLIVSDEKEWAVVIESKIKKRSLRVIQLRGHIDAMRGFPKKNLLVLTPDKQFPNLLKTVKGAIVRWSPWAEVYNWSVKQLRSSSTNATSKFLLKNLKGYLEMNASLVGFQGIDFRDGYNQLKAKALLTALMDEIQPKVLRLYPKLKKRRGRITTFGTGVWDCFGLDPFTKDLHFTVSIEEARIVVSLTLPNAAKERWSRLRQVLADSRLYSKFTDNLRSLRKEVPELWVRLAHRHFRAVRISIPDAALDLNLDTSTLMPRSLAVKRFPLWFDTAVQAIRAKGNINLQLQFQARFPKEFPRARTPQFTDVAVETFKKFKPLYDLLRS